jgi:hypothetical protein
MTHRWALLSNSPAWNIMGIRVVVANPRSYCYPDDRRWIVDHASNGNCDDMNDDDQCKSVFRPPRSEDVETCLEYNQWELGLDGGGDLVCSYRDHSVSGVGSISDLNERYALRDVIYLSGEHDVIPQFGRCGDSFQGKNRHERAKNYMDGLQEYFGRPVHDLQIVPNSNHDHSLMFQSTQGRRAILGTGHVAKDEEKKSREIDSSNKEEKVGIFKGSWTSDAFVSFGELFSNLSFRSSTTKARFGTIAVNEKQENRR